MAFIFHLKLLQGYFFMAMATFLSLYDPHKWHTGPTGSAAWKYSLLDTELVKFVIAGEQ